MTEVHSYGGGGNESNRRLGLGPWAKTNQTPKPHCKKIKFLTFFKTKTQGLFKKKC